MTPFKDHELIFLGTGGGRVLSATQHRRTGGIIYSFNGDQMHVDPGPGAIVYLNHMHLDRRKTKWIVVTHNHTDHQNDVPIIIESLHETLTIPAGTLISTPDYIQSLNSYYKSLLSEIIPLHIGQKITLTSYTSLTGIKVDHGQIEGFGFIIHQTDPDDSTSSYKLAFTSDTEIYEDFGQAYSDLDILVANVLRPGNKKCPRHACVDEIIPALRIANPKVCIITHFGALFDPPWSRSNLIESQMELIRKSVGSSTVILGAEDGMRLKISEFL